MSKSAACLYQNSRTQHQGLKLNGIMLPQYENFLLWGRDMKTIRIRSSFSVVALAGVLLVLAAPGRSLPATQVLCGGLKGSVHQADVEALLGRPESVRVYPNWESSYSYIDIGLTLHFDQDGKLIRVETWGVQPVIRMWRLLGRILSHQREQERRIAPSQLRKGG